MVTSTPAPPSSNIATKTCAGCPSFLKRDDTLDITGRNLGADVCLRKNKILSKSDGPSNLLQIQARNCDSHNQPIDGYDRNVSRTHPWMFNVAMGDFVMENEPVVSPERVRDCTDCRAYVPASTFRVKSGGWNAAFCRVTGNALLDDRLSQYASACSAKSYTATPFDPRNAQQVNDLAIKFLPEFNKNFGKVTASQLLKNRTKAFIDPKDYPTDKEVNPALTKTYGIRAFRKVVDPKGIGADVFLPIMDAEYLKTLGLYHLVPQTGDDEGPEDYVDHQKLVYRIAVMWAVLKETPTLWGDPGVGKTELFRHFAWLMHTAFNRVSITDSTDTEDLFGKTLFIQGETKFEYGELPVAWQQPNVLCLDEANTGSPAVWQGVRPLTDNSKQLRLSQNKREIIKRHRLCYLGFAMNPAWDPRNVGANPLGQADGSRLAHIWMDLPPEEVEKAIIAKRLLRDGWTDKEIWPVVDIVMKISPGIRALSANGEIPVSWGLREPMKVARLRRYLSWADSFRAGVIDQLETDQRQSVLDVVREFVPDED